MTGRGNRASHCGWVTEGSVPAKPDDVFEEPYYGGSAKARLFERLGLKRKIEDDRRRDVAGNS